MDGSVSTYNIKSGDSHVNIGKQSEGEHCFTAQVKDKYGRVSHEIYDEFRVIDTIAYNKEIEDNTVYITDDILSHYNIDRNDNPDNALATKNGMQRLMDEYAGNGVRKIVLPEGIYQMECEFWFISSVTQYNPEDYTTEQLETSLQGTKNVLQVPNNFILDMNGSTFKVKESLYWQNHSRLLEIRNKYDSHVLNGIFEGDYRRRDLTQLSNGNPRGEGGNCFGIFGRSRYSSFKNCDVKLFTGYCVTMQHDGGVYRNDISLNGFTNVRIDENGQEVQSTSDEWTCSLYELNSVYDDYRVLTVGQLLGNGWTMQTDSWNADFHFYDENRNLIKTIKGILYRPMLKPENAKYIRCTVKCAPTTGRPDVASYLTNLGWKVTDYNSPRNCELIELHFNDTRTCGLNPNQGNNNLIEGCTFIDCATNITPVAVDFEDGWFLMQDYMFRNNTVITPAGTGDMVIDAGMNLMFVDNTNFRFVTQGHYGVGYYFEGNKETKRLAVKHNNVTYPFTVYRNNEFVRNDYAWNDTTVSPIIRNHSYFEGSPVAVPNDGYHLDCEIDYNELQGETTAYVIRMPVGKYVDCIIKNETTWRAGQTVWANSELVNCETNNISATVKWEPVLFDGGSLTDVTLSYDNINCELTIRNATLTNFHFQYNNTWRNSINKVTLINCTIDNSGGTLEVFSGNYDSQSVADVKQFTIENCTLLNGTVIASAAALNNKNIVWTIS